MRATAILLVLAAAALSACPAPRADSTARVSTPDPDTVEIGGGTIETTFDGDESGVSKDVIRAYVRRAALAATLYYGRFPVKHLYVDITLAGGGAVGHGVTYMGRRIKITVGRRATEAILLDDWRMTHEMFHLGFPDMDDDYLYMEEGLSTYLEPIARARRGELSPERVWGDMLEGMVQGLPDARDKGLDHTHTWGRTYWGGCLFWLETDLAIREQTKNAKSLDDAMRAILDAGGDGSAHWDLDAVISTGDKATGTTAIRDQHKAYALTAKRTDLDALWKKLGVEQTPAGVVLHDDAPWSSLRKSITARP